MGELCQRVVLVHELGQLAAAEEFLNSCHYGADVNQCLRSDNLGILNGHALAHYALHTSQADAELVLQQLAYAANTTVAQMVDVVAGAIAIHQIQQIVEGSQHVLNGYGVLLFVNAGGKEHQHGLILEHNLDFAQALFSINATSFNLIQGLSIHLGALFQDNFAGFLVNQGLCQNSVLQTMTPA